MKRFPSHLLLALALASCTAAPAVGPRPPAGATLKPAGGRPSAAPGTPVAPDASAGARPGGGPLVPAPGSPLALPTVAPIVLPVVSNNGAGLTGKVKAPATLISDKGAGVVSNNGGGIVSNNGGAYRLATALDERPLAGAAVVLLDAAGRAVTGPDGQAVATTTDAAGGYAFPVQATDHNLIVAVTLPGERGTLRAIAPARGATAVDVDLVSSLTTHYILDRFVAPQRDQDPVAVLDRLPADVEGATRAKAASAYAAGNEAVPATLDAAAVAATVDALRRADPAFDGQMDAVRQLLVVAGQADLGNGRLATEVPLVSIDDLLPAPDGGVWFSDGSRAWHLRADGRLEAVAGGNTGAASKLDGVEATDAPLGRIEAMAADAAGRLLILDATYGRVVRVEADGRLAQLGKFGNAGFGEAIFADAGADALVFGKDSSLERSALWTFMAGGARKKLIAFPTGTFEYDYHADRAGRDEQGRLYLQENFGTTYRMTADGKGVERLAQSSEESSDLTHALDALGNRFVMDQTAKTLTLIRPSGEVRVLASGDGFRPALLGRSNKLLLGDTPVLLRPDGAVYVADRRFLYRLADGVATLIAGRQGPTAGAAADLGIQALSGFGVAPDGTLWIGDAGYLLRVPPGGQVARIAGTGETNFYPPAARLDPQPAAASAIDPEQVRFTAAGAPVANDNQRWLRELDGSQLRTRFDAGTYGPVQDDKSGSRLWDFQALPGGGFLAVVGANATGQVDLVRIPADGGAPTAVATWLPARPFTACALAVDASGAAYVACEGVLQKWTAASGLQPFVTRSEKAYWYAAPGCLAADPQGRLLLCSEGGIERYDPADGSFTWLVGKRGTIFSGASVDDGVDTPNCPSFSAAGDLYFADVGHRQIKRVPAADL